MKALILVAFLALLIASISIGDCTDYVIGTAPKIVPSSSIGAMKVEKHSYNSTGHTEQDGVFYNRYQFAPEQDEAVEGRAATVQKPSLIVPSGENNQPSGFNGPFQSNANYTYWTV